MKRFCSSRFFIYQKHGYNILFRIDNYAFDDTIFNAVREHKYHNYRYESCHCGIFKIRALSLDFLTYNEQKKLQGLIHHSFMTKTGIERGSYVNRHCVKSRGPIMDEWDVESSMGNIANFFYNDNEKPPVCLYSFFKDLDNGCCDFNFEISSECNFNDTYKHFINAIFKNNCFSLGSKKKHINESDFKIKVLESVRKDIHKFLLSKTRTLKKDFKVMYFSIFGI